MHQVIHLLPYDGIGGAEAAARSMLRTPWKGLDFRLKYIFPSVESPVRRGATFNPLAFFRTAIGITRERPDLLILSLWRSCVVGILAKAFRPRTRIVVVIHNSVDAHPADWLFTRIAMRLATEVWSDSQASLALRFRRMPKAPVHVLPFLTEHLEPAHSPGGKPPAPGFVFWGRLAAQKNLRRSLELFRIIRAGAPEARYTIIGPDAGELDGLRELCRQSGLEAAVQFTGPKSFEEIRAIAAGHRFYLQTSDYEGMAMSVVEAMQLGLVPVVTPVGEIGRYCRAGENAIVVQDVAEAAAEVLALLEDPRRERSMGNAAMATWRGQPLYRDAVAAACRRLTAQEAS